VLVLDEANLTDDRDRAVLYTEAARTGTKLVEVGDPRQLRGVGCGSLFGRVHETVGGAVLTDNRRQRDEDERAAIVAWRAGRYGQALTSWSERGRLVATETGEAAVTTMVAGWMTERAGAPDPHAEMRGVVMLAASNEVVERLNDAAQAVRAATGELGPGRDYDVRGGRHEGDHVLIRLNDRRQRMHQGPDVLNGYRGLVKGIEGDGTVRVAWQQAGADGPDTRRARLSPAYVATGGVTLGYAMTGHKAEGLTVAADWIRPDGVHQGGTVLVHAAGMDEPGLHVATSRHRDRVLIFAGRDRTSWRTPTPPTSAGCRPPPRLAIAGSSQPWPSRRRRARPPPTTGRCSTSWTGGAEPPVAAAQAADRSRPATGTATQASGVGRRGGPPAPTGPARAAAAPAGALARPPAVVGGWAVRRAGSRASVAGDVRCRARRPGGAGALAAFGDESVSADGRLVHADRGGGGPVSFLAAWSRLDGLYGCGAISTSSRSCLAVVISRERTVAPVTQPWGLDHHGSNSKAQEETYSVAAESCCRSARRRVQADKRTSGTNQ